jgi:hypothetical protein
MKLLSLLFISFLAHLAITPQSGNTTDPRLNAIYSTEFLSFLEKSDPIELQKLQFMLNETAIKVPKGPKLENATQDFFSGTLSMNQLNPLNPLLLLQQGLITQDWNKYQFYKIEKSKDILMVLPGKVVQEKFKSFLEAKKLEINK